MEEVPLNRETVLVGFSEETAGQTPSQPQRPRGSRIKLPREPPLSGGGPPERAQSPVGNNDLGMCMLTSMWGTSTVSEIFRSPAREQST